MAYRKDWRQPQVGPEGFVGTGKTIGRVINVTAADNVTGNIIGAFVVPAGFMVTGIVAVSSDLDSATALLLSVGDAASGTRYLSSSTVGQSTTAVTAVAATGLLFLNSVDTEILVTVTLQSATFVAGTLSLYLQGFIAQ